MTLRVSNGAPFTVLAPAPTLRTGIQVRVYDANSPETLLAIVARRRIGSAEWLDQLNDTGSGRFAVHEFDPVLTDVPGLLEYGNIVRFRLDGVDRFAFRIENLKRAPVPENEDEGRWIEVSGRGVLSLLEDAVIYLTGNSTTGNVRRPFNGLTAGGVMERIVDEAQARAALTGVTLGFDDVDDSEGAPFDDTLDLEERAGTDYLSVARRHAELAVDVYMSPTLRLDYFNERGVDRSYQTVDLPPVMLRPAHELASLTHEAEGVIKNVLLIEGPTAWSERQHGGSVTTYGRRETYLSLGNTSSAAQITQSADATLRNNANPAERLTFAVEDRDGNRPYVDYDVGDYVLAPNADLEFTKYRVRAITVTEDDVGVPVFVPELSTIRFELEERYQRWLKRMSPGTVSGLAADVASPTLDQTTAQAVDEKIDDHEATVLHPDELGDLTDVDTTGVADGKVLEYDGVAGLWKPATPSGGGGGGEESWGRATSAAGPGGAVDDEFDNESIAAAWSATQRSGDTNSFLEKYDRLYYRHTDQAGGSRDLHALTRATTISTGDYIEAAIFFARRSNYLGPGLVFTDGTTFGSGAQVVAWLHHNDEARHRARINGFSNFNSADGDGTQLDIAAWGLTFVRLKYEAANTFGLYLSKDGVEWYTVQTNYSKTLTPTRFGVCAVHWDNPTPPAAWFHWLYVRKNPANE